MAAWLEHDECQLQDVDQVFFAVMFLDYLISKLYKFTVQLTCQQGIADQSAAQIWIPFLMPRSQQCK